MMTKEQYDHLITRCPSLGGEVPFSYCRKQPGEKPCSRLPVCWMGKLDIERYIQTFFSPEEITAFFLQPRSGRMETFLKNLERVTTMQKEQREKLIKAINEAAPDGKISCEKATKLADEHQFPRRKMGELLDEMKIKLRNCQLGCF